MVKATPAHRHHELHDVPYLTDDQLVETFASARSLARCVRLSTQNAYLTLQSQVAKPAGDGSKVATVGGANSG
jgi:hypothetical protein